MDLSGDARIRFDDFEFDPRSGQLLRNGQPIRIQPQPLRLLKLLLERPGQTIPREELREHIWVAHIRRIRPGIKLLHPADTAGFERQRCEAGLH